jgi:hypothetical protein
MATSVYCQYATGKVSQTHDTVERCHERMEHHGNTASERLPKITIARAYEDAPQAIELPELF